MPSGPSMHELDAGQVHYEWNNAIPPRLRIEPGDTVVFQTRDAADGYYSRASTHADVVNRGPFRGHPLTGPVRGARRRARRRPRGRSARHEARRRFRLDGDPARARAPARVGVLQAVLADLGSLRRDARAHGSSRRRPHRGVPGRDGHGPRRARRAQHHAAPEERRQHGHQAAHARTPRSTFRCGCDGALFSVGDGHGAQGDGEVCVTAVEMRAQVTLRFGLQRGRHLPEPQLRTTRRLAAGTNTGPWFATTAHGPDLFASSQQRGALHDRPPRPGARASRARRRTSSAAWPSTSRSARSSTRPTGSSPPSSRRASFRDFTAS